VRVRLAPQVVEFVRTQAPEPRRQLRRAIRGLVREEGDLQALEEPLQDYWRLRVGPYRVILRYASSKTIECVFAERRGIVYETFADSMLERLEDDED
jgi:mRNA-degrading endonuclease RelE of RelBE toxin-antitoxin system